MTAAATRNCGARFATGSIAVLASQNGYQLVPGELDVDGAFNHDGTTVGLYGKAPVAHAAKINDPSGGAPQDVEARTAINAIIDTLEGVGISAA